MTGNPYVGPRPFRRTEAVQFFGRAREARNVRSIWLSERVVVLHGPAAVGKTSLLNAGVLPALAEEEDLYLLPVGRLVHQAVHPPARVSPAGAYRFTLLSSWAPGGQTPDPSASLLEFLRLATPNRPRRILAAIDQFEELFTAFPARLDDREQLMRELAEALRETPLNLLLVVRDDHLAALSAYEGRLLAFPFTYLRLDGLAPPAAIEAVRGPVSRSGLEYAPGVAEDLVERLRTVTYSDRLGESTTLIEERVEPLALQITCARLWSSLTDSEEVITARRIEEVGDPDRALATYYEEVLHEVHRETGVSEDDLRAWIEATFITEHGTRGTVYRGIARTADMPNAVAEGLTVRHILTEEQRARSIWYQLGQDRLIDVVRQANRGRGVPPGGQGDEPGVTPADFRAAAEAALGEGNFGSARRLAEMAARRFREQGNEQQFAHALALQGDIARVEGDLESARQSFDAARSEFESQQDARSTIRVLTALAEICISMGNYDEAIDLERQALERRPFDVEARTGLGYALWRRGSPADAEAAFNDALEQDRDAARALSGRGQVRIALRDYAGALADLNRALELGLPRADEDTARSARSEALRHLAG